MNAFKSSADDLVFSNEAIISILDSIYFENDENFFLHLQNIFQGTWIWELDRVAEWTISYLDTDYVRKMVGDEKTFILSDLIQQCNTVIISAYRIMYKSLLNKSKVTFNNGYKKLKDAITLQDEIYKMVKNFKCESEPKTDVISTSNEKVGEK